MLTLRPTCREILSHEHPEHALHTMTYVSLKNPLTVECVCAAKLSVTRVTAERFHMTLDEIKKMLALRLPEKGMVA